MQGSSRPHCKITHTSEPTKNASRALVLIVVASVSKCLTGGVLLDLANGNAVPIGLE